MVNTEEFVVSMSIPAYVKKHIQDKRQEITQSQYIKEVLNKYLDKIDEILKYKNTVDISVKLPIECIDKVKEIAEKNGTTAGRVIYLSLMMDFFTTVTTPPTTSNTQCGVTSAPLKNKKE